MALGKDGDLAAHLKTKFETASLRLLAEKKLSGADRIEAMDVITRYDSARDLLEADHRRHYTQRVQLKMEEIIRKNGQFNEDLKPGFSRNDLHSAPRIRREAEKAVRFAHETSKEVLRDRETKELTQILKRAGIEITPQRAQDITRFSERTQSVTRPRSR